MNYVVMDEHDDYYDDNRQFFQKKHNNTSKKKYIILFGILIFIGVLVLLFNARSQSPFEVLEQEMKNAASRYVKNNKLVSDYGIYVLVNRLSDVKLLEGCSDLSGVIVEGDELIPYLICDNYKSDIIDNNSKDIKLTGDEVIIVDKSYEYYDLGCESKYEIKINTDYVNREGVYDYEYYAINNSEIVDSIKRKVIVVDNKQLANNYPTLKLSGDEIIYLNKGEIYNELGYLAVDNLDGNINEQVKIINNINVNEVGEYQIRYLVTNSLGYTSIASRRIIVVSNDDNPSDNPPEEDGELSISVITNPTNVVNGNVTITLYVNDANYEKTLLPDGSVSNEKLTKFVVSTNGNYKFLIYKNNGEVTTKEVNITNIDKITPKAVCSATTTNNSTQITVSGVSESSCVFSYRINSYSSEYISNNMYHSSYGNATNVSVNIQDLAGNIGTINCQVEKLNKEYINDKGYNCIEPYTCFKQGDFWDTRYNYCSTEGHCGPINKTGCSITSVATILSKWNKRSSNGELFTPYTLLREVYGSCSACSGSTTSQRVFQKLGLQAWGNVGNNHYKLTMENYNVLLNHLIEGNPALIQVNSSNGGWYTTGKHLMSLLAGREDGTVFLHDTGTKKGTKNGLGHAVNTFVPLTDVINHCGKNCWFQLVKE